MKLALLFFLVALATAPEPSITVELASDAGTTIPVITVNDPKDATEIIVTTEYWMSFPGTVLPDKILLTKTSVQPIVKGFAIASDLVPVSKEFVRLVQVKLVKDVQVEQFKYQMEKP